MAYAMSTMPMMGAVDFYPFSSKFFPAVRFEDKIFT
jgi:hypothetical protein